MDGYINSLVESMFRHIGRTVTIFTTSGGLSGDGFTGVLLSVDCNVVRLLTNEGAAPACPVGSSCTGVMTPFGMASPSFGFGNGGYGFGNGGYGFGGGGYGFGGGFGSGFGGSCGGGCSCGCGGGGDDGFIGNPLGAVAVIPTSAIAVFTHNAI